MSLSHDQIKDNHYVYLIRLEAALTYFFFSVKIYIGNMCLDCLPFDSVGEKIFSP